METTTKEVFFLNLALSLSEMADIYADIK